MPARRKALSGFTRPDRSACRPEWDARNRGLEYPGACLLGKRAATAPEIYYCTAKSVIASGAGLMVIVTDSETSPPLTVFVASFENKLSMPASLMAVATK